MKKLIPALCMLLIAAVMLGTSTYAWFSMNTTVTATGMSVTATTPVNLLISATEAGTYANTASADESFGTAKLYPASSNDAKVFNAIMNSGNYINSGNGGAAENGVTKFQKTSNQADSGVVAMSGAANGYWVTYDFWVKLSEHQDAAEKVYLSDLHVAQTYVPAANHTVTAEEENLYYSDIDCTTAVAVDGTLTSGETYYMKGITRAVRVALLQGTASGTLKAIYAKTGATTPVNAVTQSFAADDTAFTGTTTSTTALTSYSYVQANSVDVNDTPVQLTLVIWIEGQDAACVNANAGATVAIDFALSVYVA